MLCACNYVYYFTFRYTADGQTLHKPDLSKMIKKEKVKEDKPFINENFDNEALFEMEGLDDDVQSTSNDTKSPKTFVAAQLGPVESEANQTVQKISAHNDFRPIDTTTTTTNLDDIKQNNNGKKKKKTRKVGSKKKHQRKSSSSSISSQSDRAGSEQRTPQPSTIPTTDINFFSDTEINANSIRLVKSIDLL